MRKLITLFAVLILSATARAEDAFYRLGINELNIKENTGQARKRTNRWGYSDNPMQPYARLDGAGEVYIDFRADWARQWNHQLSFRTMLLVRSEAGKAVKGTLYLPKLDWSGMVPFPFEIAPQQAKAEARKDFYEGKRVHYQRLLDAGIPGGAFFAHEIRAAARELGQEGRTGGNIRQRIDQLAGTFALVSGTRAVAENLALDRALPVAGDEKMESVKISTIRGVTVKAIDWTPYIKDAKPVLDPLAESIPEDQHALFLPSFDAAMALMDEGDALAAALLPLAEGHGEDARVLARYQKQLGLSANTLARLVGPKLIGSIAITGSDLYLRAGSDVAVIFQAKDAAALKQLLSAQIALSARDQKDVKTSAGAIEGIEYSGLVSPDRAVCSYLMELGGAIIVSNSLAQLDRLVDARKANGGGSLRTLPEYIFFRSRYPRGQDDETALLIISDATIRRWCSPRWRIADSRRTRAAAIMAAAGMDLLEDRIAGRSRNIELQWTEAGRLSLENGVVRSEIYGSASFMAPIIELNRERCTEDEAGAYQIWRDGYERAWRAVFDPIAAKITAQKQQLALDLTVMPLMVASEYSWYVDLSRGAGIAPGDGDPHGAMTQFVTAINKESRDLKSAADWIEKMAQPLKVDALGWVGNSMAIYFDDDAYWKDLAKARGSEDFKIDNLRRLPMGIHIESTDGPKLTAFVDAFRQIVQRFMPETIAFEMVPHKVQPYGKIIPNEKRWQVPEGFAIYYATLPDALVISFNEDVVQRALTRFETRKAAKLQGKKQEHAVRPYLGENLAVQLDGSFIEKMGMHLWPEFPHAMMAAAWGNIPILNEWKRLYPSEDPVALHERLFGVKLIGPDGSGYAWNENWQTMESVNYGHPGEPKHGPAVPRLLSKMKFINAGMNFEKEGLRARVVLERNEP